MFFTVGARFQNFNFQLSAFAFALGRLDVLFCRFALRTSDFSLHYWILELLWMLDLGFWMFLKRLHAPCFLNFNFLLSQFLLFALRVFRPPTSVFRPPVQVHPCLKQLRRPIAV